MSKSDDVYTALRDLSADQRRAVADHIVEVCSPEVADGIINAAVNAKSTLIMPKPANTEPPEAIELAVKLKENVTRRYPYSFVEKNIRITEWAADIRRMHEIEKLSWDTIGKIIDFVEQDDFWSKNIRSAKTLRAQSMKNLLPKIADFIDDNTIETV